MRRKLIRQGNESFTVTLPIKWLKQHKMKDEIEIAEKENVLEIRPSGLIEEAPKIKEFDISGLPEFLFVRIIGACYKAGYDEVKLKYSSGQIKPIKAVVSELIGYEITESKPEFLVIKRVVKSSTEQYHVSEKKCWHALQAMTEDCLEGIKANDKEKLSSVIESDSTIDKFSDYCMHMLQKYTDIEVTNSFISYLAVFQIEKIADMLLRIARASLQKKFKPSISSLNQHEAINKLISNCYSAYYSFDIKTMEKLVEERKAILLSVEKLIEKTKGAEQNYLINLREIIHLLSSLFTPIIIKSI